MRILKKKIFSVGLVVVLILTNAFVVSASEPPTEAVYDLEKGGTQTFVVEGKDGEVQQITIEEVAGNTRVADDTYKVSLSSPGAWTAGFYVKISSNKITQAYSPFYSTIVGNIQSAKLVRNSSSKATYSFIYNVAFLNFDTGVIATVSGTELKVSKI